MDHALDGLRDRPRRRLGLLRWLVGVTLHRRSRLRLDALDDHLLRDIGVTRAQARQESERTAWDVPSHWLS